jgi:hypothetical protein
MFQPKMIIFREQVFGFYKCHCQGVTLLKLYTSTYDTIRKESNASVNLTYPMTNCSYLYFKVSVVFIMLV